MDNHAGTTVPLKSSNHWYLTGFPAMFLAFGISGPAFAQSDQNADAQAPVEEVVVTGTRKEGRLPTETLSPVDVVGGSALMNQGTADLTDSLTKLTPGTDRLQEQVLEVGPAPLEADRVEVGNIVTEDLHGQAVGTETGNSGLKCAEESHSLPPLCYETSCPEWLARPKSRIHSSSRPRDEETD